MPTADLTTPLLDIIKRASERNVEGPAARLKKRFEGCSNEILVLADCSPSMKDLIGSSDLSKFEHLQIALNDVLALHPKVKIIAFSSYAKEVSDASKLPSPNSGSGTNLAAALKYAARYRPLRTIVISDGIPDSEEHALAAADKLSGSIDTIYCGPDAHPAVQFLTRLSREAGGAHVTWDGYKPLSSAVRGLLPAVPRNPWT